MSRDKYRRESGWQSNRKMSKGHKSHPAFGHVVIGMECIRTGERVLIVEYVDKHPDLDGGLFLEFVDCNNNDCGGKPIEKESLRDYTKDNLVGILQEWQKKVEEQ